ncbi:MAG: aconitate hydratase AcnA [Nitrosomonadaceae bacterium]|nr:aconitate hydratase AcnA [Nitrosomonadaceae bacterium]
MPHNQFNNLKNLTLPQGGKMKFYSLPALEKMGFGKISRLPVCIRIVLESIVRNYDDKKITATHVKQLARWNPNAARTDEIPFIVARIVLQDFTGIPLLADLAAMRSAAKRSGGNPKVIEPLVPVDLVVDHSVQVDHFGNKKALDLNMEIEFRRNNERYQFIKWGMQAFQTFKVVPPGVGIVHQVNLEYLARGVHQKNNVLFPDTLVGTDSHTTMINSIGAVGWGVGGIEAEAGMLGQPVYFLTPDVIGVNLTGRLRRGVTATDLVLSITELLRKAKVVGKFVEFFGDGTKSLSLPDRATIANMAPEYGATMGFFPVDGATIDYFKNTGRSDEEISMFQSYFEAQELYGTPLKGEIDYTSEIDFDLGSVAPSLAGPKHPQDRIEIGKVKDTFTSLFTKPIKKDGYARDRKIINKRYSENSINLGHGDVLIAAITSCTNTSNPSVLIAAGLLAKKAVEKGLKVKPHIKTSLAPGSRVVTEYLTATGLLPYLEKLGFNLVGYGCTTCIGNSGPLQTKIEEAIIKNDLVCAAVLSGNRNFEARVHPNIQANFLASPPLVVSYAIAGTMLKDLMTEPLGIGKDGNPVWLGDIWPSNEEINGLMRFATNAETFRKLYCDLTKDHSLWNSISSATGGIYNWPESTYIAEPPFFQDFNFKPVQLGKNSEIINARALGIFGNSLTTDHISPAGAIKDNSPAGKYLLANNIAKTDFNSYGSRRGNHDVMIRGTFANVRIKNLMIPGSEGGITLYQSKKSKSVQMSIYDAAMKYMGENKPTIIFGGEEYGTGSSRDWAAKGTQLLGIKAVITKSFERIHRSNLVGMGVLPLQFKGNDSVESLKINGSEQFDILGLDDIRPQQDVTLIIRDQNGTRKVKLLCRIDTPIEVDYFMHGGILPYVLKELMTV